VILDPAVAVVPELDAGEWYEIESDVDFVARASAPISIGQFLAGFNAAGGSGDPSFILAPPVRQLRSTYRVFATGPLLNEPQRGSASREGRGPSAPMRAGSEVEVPMPAPCN
jgi:hypothetical protein